MGTRCRPGDLAMIIKDEVGCEGNIGRFVRVFGPKRVCLSHGATWLIDPVTSAPYVYMSSASDNRVVLLQHGQKQNIEHPDAWMIPIRPRKSRSKAAASRKLREFQGSAA